MGKSFEEDEITEVMVKLDTPGYDGFVGYSASDLKEVTSTTLVTDWEVEEERVTLEEKILSWEEMRTGTDLPNAGVWSYKNATLRVEVGEHPIGTKFDVAIIDTTASKLILVKDKQEEQYAISITIGARL